MKVASFEDYFSPVILQRGREYYRSGLVTDLEELHPGTWEALVAGTYDYIVEIELDENGLIEEAICGCPYDYGDSCKHIAAVMYEIRGYLQKRKPLDTEKLAVLLGKKSKEELVSLLINIAFQNDEIAASLLAGRESVGRMRPQMSREEAVNIINQSVEQAFARRHARQRPVDYLAGTEEVLGEAREAFNREEYEYAVFLCLIVYECMCNMYEEVYDEEDRLMDGMYDSFNLLEEAVVQGVDEWEDETKADVFKRLLAFSQEEFVSLYGEGVLPFYEICMLFTEEEVYNNRLYIFLDNQSREESSYYTEHIKLMQLALLEQREDAEAADAFVRQHIHFTAMRSRLIEQALIKKQANTALQLCLQGKEQDEQKPGLVSQWENYEYDVYRLLGNSEKMKEMAYGKIMKGDMEYFDSYKQLFEDAEWPAALEQIMKDYRNVVYVHYLYIQKLLEENQLGEILYYCQQNPEYIQTYARYLNGKYPEQTKTLYRDYIFHKAEWASSRPHYRDIARLVGSSSSSCGRQSAEEIVKELRNKYPRKPAFMDELNKVNWEG